MNELDLPALKVRALELHRRGDLVSAEVSYAAILAIAPLDSDTLHLSGVAALQRGDAATAVERIGKAVADRPLPLYLVHLGAALRRADRPQDAVVVLRRAIALDPSMAEAHCNLASALCSVGAWDAAIAASHEALAHRHDLPEAHLNHATALAALGRPLEAEAAARRALSARPHWPEALLQIGGALLAQDRPIEAVQAYRAAVALRPGYVAAVVNLGSALGRAGQLEEAASTLLHAALLAPDQPEALLNLGGVLRALGRLEEARAAQEKILARDPDYWAAWSNLGAILHDLGVPADAEAAWQRSLSLKPDQPDVRYSRALSLLLAGNLAEGWEALEYRWAATQHRGRARHTHLPLWGGEDFSGRTLLLHAEEGLGDSIQFSRYVPLVAARGGRVLLETYAPLARLFAGLHGVAQLAVQGEPLPEADLQCPLQSLPRAFGTRLETIPGDVPYLRAEASPLHRWRARLGTLGPRIGLVWAGSPTHGKDRDRSIAFSNLAPLWCLPGLHWFSLQVGDRAADLAIAPPGMVTDLSPYLTDMAETAAALCCLDLLIAVDTSVAHLGGALGCPVWLLLPRTPDWRWLLGRDDSPWYHTMRLFRQSQRGDWAAVVLRVASALGGRKADPYISAVWPLA